MKNSKNKRAAILAGILIGLLIIAYKVMFAPAKDMALVTEVEEETAGVRISRILDDVSNINFDTAIMTDLKFRSLQSIEIPMASLPVGRRNPFSETIGSN